VIEGAARELARLRQAQAIVRRERSKRRSNHRRSAMQMQLGDIFAGEGMRRREP
jgi:hypothetical protein